MNFKATPISEMNAIDGMSIIISFLPLLGSKFCLFSQVSVFERIWESDTLLDPQQTALLRTSFDSLISATRLNQDNITRNPIDPSLYCLIYNRTLVSHLHGRAFKPIPPPPSTDIYTISPDLALLPSDVFISDDLSRIKFLSYINGLDPTCQKNTYTLLQGLLRGFIPLFEHTLTDLHRNNPLVERIPGACRYSVWDEPEAPDHSDDEEGWVNYEREMRSWTLNRPIDLPDVSPAGYRGGLDKRRHTVHLRNRVVQVIVSSSNITLVRLMRFHRRRLGFSLA